MNQFELDLIRQFAGRTNPARVSFGNDRNSLCDVFELNPNTTRFPWETLFRFQRETESTQITLHVYDELPVTQSNGCVGESLVFLQSTFYLKKDKSVIVSTTKAQLNSTLKQLTNI